MKILNRVTLACLKKNKVRTVVTVIGIILSTAMFTAVTTSITSLQNYMLATTVADEGNWEGSFYGILEDAYQEVIRAEEVKDWVGLYEIGYMKLSDTFRNGEETFNWNDSSYPYLQFVSLLGDVEAAKRMINFETIEGRMPERENEIMISEEFINYGRQKLKIGDTVTGSIGYREYEGTVLTGHDWLIQKKQKQENVAPGAASDGEEPNGQVKTYVAEQLVTDGQAGTYTVVGICRLSGRRYATPGFTVFCGAGLHEAKQLSAGRGVAEVFFTMKDQKGIFDFLDRYKASALDYDYHSHLLYTNGIGRADSFSHVYFGMGIILCIIIVFGSVALIYNAFSISVNERIKQFGLLASIGATKRQLKRSVLFEACTVSLFGIPLGIGAGILGMSITFYALRYRFMGLVGSAHIPFSMHVKGWALLAAAVLAFFTVLLSAILPARGAMRIPAIEAIRQNSEIRVNKKAVRTRGFLYKLYGTEGMLADKNFRRNRKKYRATVISLFVSIVLFISASSFVDYLKGSATSVTAANNYDFRYYVYPDRGYTAREVQDAIAPVEGVAKAFEAKTLHDTVLVNRGLLTTAYTDYAEASGSYSYERGLARETTGRDRFVPVMYFYFMDDDEYIAYTEENNLTALGWFSEEKGALVFDGIRVELSGNRYTTLDVLREKSGVLTGNFFDIIYTSDVEPDNGKDVPETSQAEGGSRESQGLDLLVEGETFSLPYTVVDAPLPTGVNRQILSFVYPLSAFPWISAFTSQDTYQSEVVYVVGEGNLVELYDRVCKELMAQGIPNSSFYSIAEQDAFARNIIVIINVFSYGFIVLISLIAAANVFNTVSTNISLRHRELAMLESIGMTKKGLHKMLNYECLLYGIKSLCAGLPVAALVTFAIYRVVNEGYVQNFYIPAGSILVAVLSVFAVVFATMSYSVVKLEKNSLVDTLKNENV